MKKINRTYTPYLQEFLGKKTVLITGPRQCGKTTASRMLAGTLQYLNFDYETDRHIINEMSWDRSTNIIIFDELHKKQDWKQWIKGIIDREGLSPALVVTGSASLNTYKKFGDSLAGRYFEYRMHPFDVRELCQVDPALHPEEVLERTMRFSGFPEPYLENSERFYNLWKRTHLDIILRQDLISLEPVRDIVSIELLLNLLKKRVGSPLSYSSLANDLKVSDKTVKHWLQILEEVFVVFKITPYHKNIARAVQKQPKYYFFDNARVESGKGALLENAVACSLLKECQFRRDCLGEEWNLHYLAKRGGVEVDFLIVKNGKPHIMIEVKHSASNLSTSFNSFSSDLPDVKKVQLVKELPIEKTYPDGSEIRRAGKWLSIWQ